MKRYKIRRNVGKSKYVVSYHDGIKRHGDGSDFFDIAIFKNKKNLNAFVANLNAEGFVEGF